MRTELSWMNWATFLGFLYFVNGEACISRVDKKDEATTYSECQKSCDGVEGANTLLNQ